VVLRVALPGMVSGRLPATLAAEFQDLVRLDELFGSRTGQLLTASAPAPGASAGRSSRYRGDPWTEAVRWDGDLVFLADRGGGSL
jgi:hypothetical protein